jgi:hypothetical protein
MKVNKKALELIDKGLSSKTVSKLTESQINVLHKKLFVEETMVSKTDAETISKLKSEKKPFQVYEKELEEDDDFDLDADQAYTGQQGSHDEYQSSDDGMDDDTSPENHDSKMIGMSEEKDEPNPWAICHSQVGPKKSRKWERCVREVKKQLKEGKNPVSLFLETQIERIVEKHIPPRITKGDLMKVLSESEPTTAPTKPKTKPGTKPDTRPRPSHPGKNPNPGENPAPKAKKSETKEQQTSPAPTTKPAPTKPGTKPDTRPRPSHPGKNPNPGENPAPKAKKVSPEQAKDKVIDVIMNLLKK